MYRAITPYAVGWLAMGFDGNQVFLDSDGRTERSQPGSDFVVNAAGSQVAYVNATEGVQDGPKLVLAPTMGSESLKQRQPVPADARPVGFLDDDTVVYRTEGEQPETFVTSFDGTEKGVPGLMGASGVSESGLIAGMTKSMVDGSCSAVVRAEGFEQLWETCDFALGKFSPDGRHVIGTDAYGDGAGSRSVAVLDARTSDVVVDFEQGRDTQILLGQMVWEDNEHVLATVAEGTEWRIMRFGLDGSMEAATDPVPTEDIFGDFPLWFSTQP